MPVDKWKWTDIQEAVEWAREQEQERWVARPVPASREPSDYVVPLEIDSSERE